MSHGLSELINAVFAGSLTLTAMLLAVFSFLADRFYSLRKGAEYISKPYKYLAIGTVVVICVSSLTTLLSFMYLNRFFYPYDTQVLLWLFVFLLTLIPSLVIIIAAKYLHG